MRKQDVNEQFLIHVSSLYLILKSRYISKRGKSLRVYEGGMKIFLLDRLNSIFTSPFLNEFNVKAVFKKSNL